MRLMEWLEDNKIKNIVMAQEVPNFFTDDVYI